MIRQINLPEGFETDFGILSTFIKGNEGNATLSGGGQSCPLEKLAKISNPTDTEQALVTKILQEAQALVGILVAIVGKRVCSSENVNHKALFNKLSSIYECAGPDTGENRTKPLMFAVIHRLHWMLKEGLANLDEAHVPQVMEVDDDESGPSAPVASLTLQDMAEHLFKSMNIVATSLHRTYGEYLDLTTQEEKFNTIYPSDSTGQQCQEIARINLAALNNPLAYMALQHTMATRIVAPLLNIQDLPHDDSARKRWWLAIINGLGFAILATFGFKDLGLLSLNLLLASDDKSLENESLRMQLYVVLGFLVLGLFGGYIAGETNRSVFTDTSKTQRERTLLLTDLKDDTDLHYLTSETSRYRESFRGKLEVGAANGIGGLSVGPLMANALLAVPVLDILDKLSWPLWARIALGIALFSPSVVSFFCSLTNYPLNSTANEENLVPYVKDGFKWLMSWVKFLLCRPENETKALLEKFRHYLITGVENHQRHSLEGQKETLMKSLDPAQDDGLVRTGFSGRTLLEKIYSTTRVTEENSFVVNLLTSIQTPLIYGLTIYALTGITTYVAGVAPMLEEYIFDYVNDLLGNLLGVDWSVIFKWSALALAALTAPPYLALTARYMPDKLKIFSRAVPIAGLTLGCLDLASGFLLDDLSVTLGLGGLAVIVGLLEIYAIMTSKKGTPSLPEFLGESVKRLGPKAFVMGSIAGLTALNSVFELINADEHPYAFAYFLFAGPMGSIFVNIGAKYDVDIQAKLDELRVLGTDGEKRVAIYMDMLDLLKKFYAKLDHKALAELIHSEFYSLVQEDRFKQDLSEREKAILVKIQGNDIPWDQLPSEGHVDALHQQVQSVGAPLPEKPSCWAGVFDCMRRNSPVSPGRIQTDERSPLVRGTAFGGCNPF